MDSEPGDFDLFLRRPSTDLLLLDRKIITVLCLYIVKQETFYETMHCNDDLLEGQPSSSELLSLRLLLSGPCRRQ